MDGIWDVGCGMFWGFVNEMMRKVEMGGFGVGLCVSIYL